MRSLQRAIDHSSNGKPTLGKSGLYRILVALAMHPEGLNAEQIGIFSMLKHGGTFSTYMSRGKTAGWIEDRGQGFTYGITAAGLIELGSYEPIATGYTLARKYHDGMGGSGQARIFQVFIERAKSHHPPLDYETIARDAGLALGGTFSTYMSRLRSSFLIVEVGGKRFELARELRGT